MKRWLTALVAMSASGVANAAEVIESTFQTTFTHDGQSYNFSDMLVPNLPDSACYNWYLKFDPGTKTELTLIETLTLPAPLAAWQNYVNDPASTTQINADAQSAVTMIVQWPDEDGWVTHGWCVAAGDPNGAHSISVVLDGAEIARWDFSVLAPEDYAFPADAPGEDSPSEIPVAPPPPAPPPQPSPLARDVNQSW